MLSSTARSSPCLAIPRRPGSGRIGSETATRPGGGGLEIARPDDDLTLLYGIGPRRAALLRRLGIRRLEDLLDCDLGEVGWCLSRRDEHVTMEMLEGFRLHARSYLSGRPVLTEPLPDVGATYTVIDFDYEPFRLIWLVGIQLVDEGRVRHLHLWAEDADGERRSLKALAATLRERRKYPVLSWAGLRADLPQLRAAVERLGLNGRFTGAFEAHLDLFEHFRRSVRIPVPGLGLGPVASYFGFERESRIEDGLHALRMFGVYRDSTQAGSRARLREDLIGSNREDLRALTVVEHALRALSPEPDAADGPQHSAGGGRHRARLSAEGRERLDHVSSGQSASTERVRHGSVKEPG